MIALFNSPYYKYLIWLSVALYFTEVSVSGASNSLSAPAFFLWSERLIAIIFTAEIFIRCSKEKRYIGRGLFWIDVIAVFPFWIGFFVSEEWLGWVRTLRTLRLLKLYRYEPSLQKLHKAFVLAWPSLRGAAMTMLITCSFAAALIYQVEKDAQPEAFGNIWNCLYYCLTTATTVGFGSEFPITPFGKFLTITLLYGPAIAMCGVTFGIMSNAYSKIDEQTK